ncbi:MAG TPA: response regulator [Pyrinomonadaceae bacterium]|nr:response regulator [Pyrinomonadaceae bacterium]
MNPTTPDTLAPNTPPHARPTVLVAEDDRALRRYLEVVLQRAGYEVVAAADGLEAMKAALNGSFQAVVTDAAMPHLNGHELCRFLRSQPRFRGLPVLFLSGSEQDGQAGAYADAHLSKPVRPEELTARLAELLARHAA